MGFAERAIAAKTRLAKRYGTTGSLRHLPGSTTDEGILLTPINSLNMFIAARDGARHGTRVSEEFFECDVLASDPNLSSPPKIGDLLTVGNLQYRIIEGSRPEHSNDRIIAYRMRLRAANG